MNEIRFKIKEESNCNLHINILIKILKFFKSRFVLELTILKRPKFQKIIKEKFHNLNIEFDDISCGNVIIDGTWENPNYWIRLQLILKALCIKNSQKTGILGKYSRRSVKRTFKIFNINKFHDVKKKSIDLDLNIQIATRLVRSCKSQKDILNWELPEKVPPTLIYDSLLKSLNKPTIDLKNPMLINLVAKALNDIQVAKSIFSQNKYSLYICSHTLGIFYGSLAWMAVKNNVDVICLYGDYGSSRFLRIKNLMQLKNTVLTVPSKSVFFQLSELLESRLLKIGKMYMDKKLDGKINDIGASLAFRNKNEINADEIREFFNWPKNKKIVTIYTQNWADFPYSLGMKNFIDFKEWFDITKNIAIENDDILWLFKEHPVITLYKYDYQDTVKFMIDSLNIDHIKTAPNSWNNKSIMKATDYAITCNGSIGFELSSQGKSVLIADQAWYSDLGFGLVSKSQKDYVNNLKISWWNKIDLKKSKFNALKFIGLYLCLPYWQKNFTYYDDYRQDLIYYDFENFFNINKEHLIKEIYFIRKWYKSETDHYHLYKMLNDKNFVITNIIK